MKLLAKLSLKAFRGTHPAAYSGGFSATELKIYLISDQVRPPGIASTEDRLGSNFYHQNCKLLKTNFEYVKTSRYIYLFKLERTSKGLLYADVVNW